MSCILRAGGKDFDVDAFLRQTSMVPDSCWRRGEKRYPGSVINEKITADSGVRFLASGAEFSELQKQIEDALKFLRKNEADLEILLASSGLEGAMLDFGAEIHPSEWASFTFPPELTALAGGLGISICLSLYPAEEEMKSRKRPN